MVQGRPKGVRAEREVAALLAEWWSAVEPEVQFVRTPLSGGWSNPTVRGGFRASGDIMTTSQTFPFVVEVKRREGFTWDTFLKGRASPVWGWWEQTVRAAGEQDGVPMLWLRHNGEPWRIAMPARLPEGVDPIFGTAWLVRHHVSRRFVVRESVTPARGWSHLPAVCVLAANAVLAVSPGAFLPPRA